MDVDIWEEEFGYEIEEREVPGEWILKEHEGLQHAQEKGVKYTQRTFGSFICSRCKRRWNSAEVHVIFCMNLNRSLQNGTVKMRIFKQECKKCRFPKLEKPEISHENIVRINKNLVNRILLIFYGEKKVKQELKPEVYSVDMEGPHDKEHCEACKLMICKWTIADKEQIAVKSSSPKKKPKNKPKTPKKEKQCQSHGLTSTYAYTNAAQYPSTEASFQSTATNPDYESDFQSTATYPDYESGFQSSSTKQKIAVKSSSAKNKPKEKPKKPKKNAASAKVNYQTTAIYPYYESDLRFSSTYSDYESDFKSSLTYPYYTTKRNTAYSPPRQKEASSFPILTSVILGIGALALWYLRK